MEHLGQFLYQDSVEYLLGTTSHSAAKLGDLRKGGSHPFSELLLDVPKFLGYIRWCNLAADSKISTIVPMLSLSSADNPARAVVAVEFNSGSKCQA